MSGGQTSKDKIILFIGKTLLHKNDVSWFLSVQLNKVEILKMDTNQNHRNTRRSAEGNTTLIFSLKNEVGSLVQALHVFQVGVSFTVYIDDVVLGIISWRFSSCLVYSLYTI